MTAKTTLVRIAAAAAVALLGSAAHADDITVATEAGLSLKSRAEVRAEVQQAAQAGTLIGAGEYVAVQANADAAPAVAREATRVDAVSAQMAFASLYLAG